MSEKIKVGDIVSISDDAIELIVRDIFSSGGEITECECLNLKGVIQTFNLKHLTKQLDTKIAVGDSLAEAMSNLNEIHRNRAKLRELNLLA